MLTVVRELPDIYTRKQIRNFTIDVITLRTS